MVSLLVDIIYVFVAIGFFFGGIRNLFSSEGRYDAESSRIMSLSAIFGIVFGGLMIIAVLAHFAGKIDVPFLDIV